MDVDKQVEELRGKIRGSGLDFAKVEQHLREFLIELNMKRNQVNQLGNDLNEARSQNFDLIRQIEIVNSTLKETQFNLTLAKKNSTIYEEKLKSFRDNYVNLKVKDEMKVAEINTLNDRNQKLQKENMDLVKELDDLKDKLQYNKIFQEQLQNRYQLLKIENEGFQSDIACLKIEQAKIHEINNQLEIVDGFIEVNKRLIYDNKKLKEDKDKFENSLIQITAKFECLERLMKMNENLNEQNLIAKIKLLQNKVAAPPSDEKLKVIVSNLTESLNEEISANAKLILKLEEYESKIEQLESKMKTMELTPCVKPEIIELQDES